MFRLGQIPMISASHVITKLSLYVFWSTPQLTISTGEWSELAITCPSARLLDSRIHSHFTMPRSSLDREPFNTTTPTGRTMAWSPPASALGFAFLSVKLWSQWRSWSSWMWHYALLDYSPCFPIFRPQPPLPVYFSLLGTFPKTCTVWVALPATKLPPASIKVPWCMQAPSPGQLCLQHSGDTIEGQYIGGMCHHL